MTGAIGDALRHYATFHGRTSRRDALIFLVAFSLGNYVLVNATKLAVASGSGPLAVAVATISAVFFAALILPMSAVTARRLQDTGRPAVWTLIPTAAVTFISVAERLVIGQGYAPLIPVFLGSAPFVLWFLWWLTRPGDPGENRFGPPPGRQ
ncbi:DUF805 domain-containing protein [Maritimibacter sp. UBA3975]|uniref:DUF805 domain-containing protein n=1 Tax=Maritimibacter sp. UBA3975 TaxID=1946833 RepID=UPI0025BCAD67|nr:DUF805 domain-containing protein [Maritimibacter sp. UBA3975]